MSRHIISSVRVYRRGRHANLHVWNRGGLAGELIVNEQDAGEIASRLIGEDSGVPIAVQLKNDERDYDLFTVDEGEQG